MNEQELAKVREIIAEQCYLVWVNREGFEAKSWAKFSKDYRKSWYPEADQILNTPIPIERDCP